VRNLHLTDVGGALDAVVDNNIAPATGRRREARSLMRRISIAGDAAISSTSADTSAIVSHSNMSRTMSQMLAALPVPSGASTIFSLAQLMRLRAGIGFSSALLSAFRPSITSRALWAAPTPPPRREGRARQWSACNLSRPATWPSAPRSHVDIFRPHRPAQRHKDHLEGGLVKVSAPAPHYARRRGTAQRFRWA
jgi:hypothetical protein